MNGLFPHLAATKTNPQAADIQLCQSGFGSAARKKRRQVEGILLPRRQQRLKFLPDVQHVLLVFTQATVKSWPLFVSFHYHDFAKCSANVEGLQSRKVIKTKPETEKVPRAPGQRLV